MDQSPRYCQKCGSQLSPNARFCPRCGTQAPAVQAGLPPQPAQYAVPPAASPTYLAPQPAEAYPPSSAPSKPARQKWVVLVVALVAVCCIATLVVVGGLWGFSKYVKKSKSTSIPTSQPTFTLTPQTTAIAPTNTPIPTASGVSVSFSGASFTFDPALANGAQSEAVAPVTDGPPFDLVPENTRFTLQGYTLYPGASFKPQIMLYPVDKYIALNPDVSQIVHNLNVLLADKPASGPGRPLPFLPTWNAGQVMQAEIRYLDFQGGSGVRYLTQYAQGFAPINNQILFYTFQGLTTDQRTYISAIMPVSNPVLPDAKSVTVDDAFTANFDTYVKDTVQKLNAQPDGSYTPNLALLDAMFKTLQVK